MFEIESISYFGTVMVFPFVCDMMLIPGLEMGLSIPKWGGMTDDGVFEDKIDYKCRLQASITT